MQLQKYTTSPGYGIRVHHLISSPPTPSNDWYERWEGADKGIICSWLRGIEKAIEDPVLAAKAKAGELPVLAWKGGIKKYIERTDKIGALQYLAAWQGLRGEDLDITLGKEIHMKCTRTGVPVKFTDDINQLLKEEDEQNVTRRENPSKA